MGRYGSCFKWPIFWECMNLVQFLKNIFVSRSLLIFIFFGLKLWFNFGVKILDLYLFHPLQNLHNINCHFFSEKNHNFWASSTIFNIFQKIETFFFSTKYTIVFVFCSIWSLLLQYSLSIQWIFKIKITCTSLIRTAFLLLFSVGQRSKLGFYVPFNSQV